MVSLSDRQTSKIYGIIASTTINRSRIDAEANDPARVLIHDHQDPVGTQRSRFAPEQIHAPEAVFRVPQESQPGKTTRARLGSARVCSMAWWRSGQLTPHRGLLRNEANLVCYGPTAGPPGVVFSRKGDILCTEGSKRKSRCGSVYWDNFRPSLGRKQRSPQEKLSRTLPGKIAIQQS